MYGKEIGFSGFSGACATRRLASVACARQEHTDAVDKHDRRTYQKGDDVFVSPGRLFFRTDLSLLTADKRAASLF
jgi:hypothetical protein